MRAEEYAALYELEGRHFWMRGVRSLVRDQLDGGADRPLSILDVGCGTGGTRAWLPGDCRYLGVDAYGEALGFARRRAGGARFLRASAEALPLCGAQFDRVLALDVIEHCDRDELAARELLRVLRPGGRLILTVPANPGLWSEHDEALHHRRRYTRAGLARLLEGAGFRLERLTFFNTLLFPPIAAVRWAKRLLPRRRAPRSDLRLALGPVNEALAAVFGLERRVLEHVDLPFGVSLLVVARR